jgi:hypothetical protein
VKRLNSGKQCTNIFNNSQELLSTLISEEKTNSKLFLNELIQEISKKLEDIV